MRNPFLAGALAVLLGLSLAACGDDDDADDSSSANGDSGPAPTLPIDQIVTFDVPSRNHSDRVVDYPQTPPVGGDHADAWQTCAFYDEPIFKEVGTHSLEHGAVWITYRPDIAAAEIDQIRALAEQPETLASPWDEAEDGNLPAPIVVSAWGAQVGVETISAPVVEEFINQYREAPTSPEAGVPCSQGITTTK